MPAVAAKQTRPVAWALGALTIAFKWWIIGPILIWFAAKKGARWFRVLTYHPIALGLCTMLVLTWWLNHLLPAILLGIVYVRLGTWMITDPALYRRHIHPRIGGTFWALRYRLAFARKLQHCGLFKPNEPRPQLLGVQQVGCTVKALAWQSDGMKIEDWKSQADRIAPAFNAQDCKVRAVWKDGELQPKRVELELLTRNPFKRPVGVEFIDFHLDPGNVLPLEGNVTSMRRDGSGYGLAEGRHLLVVGETGSGKSNYLRARMYANRYAIGAGLLEVWGADGGGGVEISYMEHLFARTCYGDGKDLDEFNGEEFGEQFALFFEDAVRIMIRRLKDLRGDDVVHTPTPDAPALEVIVDELLVFDSAFVNGQHRKRIYSSIELIQRQGRKARVRIVGCAQDANMEDLPVRRGFTDRRVYRVKEAIQVDMAAGRGVWERGGKSDQIPVWQQGTSFEEREGGTTPEQIRDAFVSNTEIRELPPCPPSRLWHPEEFVVPEAQKVGPPSLAEPMRVNPARRTRRHAARRPGHEVEPSGNGEVKEKEEVLR